MTAAVTSWGHEFKTGRDITLHRVFGRMVDQTDGVVMHYRGDLMMDALWLEANAALEGSDHFYWSCNLTGTAIGRDRDLVGSRENLYLVTVNYDKDQTKWSFNLEAVTLVKGLTEDEAIDAGLVPPR